MDANDVLKHYGILGMRWGVRGGKGAPTAAPTKVSDDYKRARETAKRDPRSLSNDEMRELVNRLELEKRYNAVANKKGKSFTQKFISNLGDVATEQIKSVAGKLIRNKLESIIFNKATNNTTSPIPQTTPART